MSIRTVWFVWVRQLAVGINFVVDWMTDRSRLLNKDYAAVIVVSNYTSAPSACHMYEAAQILVANGYALPFPTGGRSHAVCVRILGVVNGWLLRASVALRYSRLALRCEQRASVRNVARHQII